METLKKILDLPVIVQGALGSFLFWILFEASRRAVAAVGKLVGKHNRNWRHEALVFERLQALAMSTNDHELRSGAMLGCLFGGLSRAVQGLIYMSFGLITQELIGPVSIAAYGIGLIYFFRALQAVGMEFNSGRPSDYYPKRLKAIEDELKQFDKVDKGAANS